MSVLVVVPCSKRKMDEFRGLVNWSEEIRRFIGERVRGYEQLESDK